MTPQEPSIEEDDNSTAPGNVTTAETDWPDALTVQIPGVSLTTSDQPPEVTYNKCQTQPSPANVEILELEEDSDQDQFDDPDYLINQHNTHQESQKIRHEYSARLQDLSDNKYYAEIDNPTEL